MIAQSKIADEWRHRLDAEVSRLFPDLVSAAEFAKAIGMPDEAAHNYVRMQIFMAMARAVSTLPALDEGLQTKVAEEFIVALDRRLSHLAQPSAAVQ